MKWSSIGLALVLALGLSSALAQTQSNALVPSAMTQFVDQNGKPLNSARVYFYVPGTTTPSPTWVDPYMTTLNSNPVVLDGAGRAVIWGNGLYRQVLIDQFGNTVWDQLTYVSPPIGANATGTGLVVLQSAPAIISPTLSGVPTAPTAALGTSTTQIASTAFVAAAIAAIVPPTQAVPSGAIESFYLNACPAGWVVANGTGGTPDMRGVVARGLDLGRGLDVSGTGLGGYEPDMFQTHTMAAPGGSAFVTLPGGIQLGTAGPIGTISISNSSTGGPNSGSFGYETRAKATVLLTCMKS
jgi:hypothetical protein